MAEAPFKYFELGYFFFLKGMCYPPRSLMFLSLEECSNPISFDFSPFILFH